MRNSPDVVDGFRMRGREGTRLESFSDAVFAFALTLIVVSLEVPKSFADLIGVMRGFPAFALCFTVLATIWNTHYKFSRRYGLDDTITRFLTCVLLFIVLFFVYPLKFLFSLSIGDMLFGRSVTAPLIRESEVSTLFSIYSFGFAGVYLAFTLLYLHAWRLRDVLELIGNRETRNPFCYLPPAHSGCRRIRCCGIGPPAFVSVVGWANLFFACSDLARTSHDASAAASCATDGHMML